MRTRRAFLYVPGDDSHKIEKASKTGADCVCMDLEDGVAVNKKIEGRGTICHALQTVDFGTSERVVRINALTTGMAEDDLAAVLPGRPDAILLPKAASSKDIILVSQLIGEVEKAHGWQTGSIRLLTIIESGRALVNLPEIAGADPRLEALIMGAEDLVADLGATRTRQGLEILYARSAVVAAAAAFNLQAIDVVCVDFRDPELFNEEAHQGAQMGFVGKQVIHPNQVAAAQEAFTPSDEAIAKAQRIVSEFEAYQAVGTGAFAVDGKMVDMPVIRAAENILQRARAAGKI